MLWLFCLILTTHESFATIRTMDLIHAQFQTQESITNSVSGSSSFPMVVQGHWYQKKVEPLNSDKITRLEWNDKLDYFGSTHDDHKIKTITLPWFVPFYGRLVNTFNITTAGSIIMDQGSPLVSPSYIAPLMTFCRTSETTVTWQIVPDKKFTVRWKILFEGPEKTPTIAELHLDVNGSMTFLYKGIKKEIIQDCLANGYSFVIGLFDSFTTQSKYTREVEVGLYPRENVDVNQILDQAHQVIISPLQTNGSDCFVLSTSMSCHLNSNCKWCSNQCVYYVESFRKPRKCPGRKLRLSDILDFPGIRSPYRRTYNFHDVYMGRAKEITPCESACILEGRSFVCGSDGYIYDNKCYLERQRCLSDPYLRVVSDDICSADCQAVCPTDYLPFCGSNHNTYSNLCKLNLKKCEEKNLVEHSPGTCDLVPLDEEFYSYDESQDDPSDFEDDDYVDLDLAEEKGCNTTCSKEKQPICLNGERDFANKCLMELAICAQNVTKIHWQMGSCPSKGTEERCSTKGCTKEFKPVCGNNGKTYANLCILEHLSCMYNLNLTVEKLGPCEIRSEPDSNCLLTACTRENNPVCGTDGTTYGNRCLLDAAMECDSSLSFERFGPCKSDSMQLEPSPNIQQPIPKDMEPNYSEAPAKPRRLVRGFVMVGGMLIVLVMVVALVRRYKSRSDQNNFSFPDQEHNPMPSPMNSTHAVGAEFNRMTRP